jgi:hypothetical protein
MIARDLTDIDSGFLNGARYLVHDRDPQLSDESRNIPNPTEYNHRGAA